MIDDTHARALLSRMVEISRTFRSAGQRGGEQSPTGTKYGFLKHLREQDARLGELAQRLAVSAPVASRAIDALVADHLVERRPDPDDARATLISITEQGRSRLAEAESRTIHRFAEALAGWSPDDAAHAIALLETLNHHLADVLQPADASPRNENESHE